MTLREASEYLCVPEATLYDRVWRRVVPHVRLGRSIRFDVRDLDDLIERCKIHPNPEFADR